MITSERMVIDFSHETINSDDLVTANLIATVMGLNSETAAHAEKSFFPLVTDAMDVWGLEPIEGNIPVGVRLGAALIMRECGHELLLPAELVNHPELKPGNLINPQYPIGAPRG
jgi:hypothetical protein